MIPNVAKPILRIVVIIRGALGVCFGLYLFTYGQYFYEHFGSAIDAKHAMFLIMTLLAVRQGCVALLEVPTGAIGDTLGRATTVKWSFFCRMLFFLGLAAMALSSNVTIAFLVGLFASIAFSMASALFSGNFTAWVVDSLRIHAPGVGSEALITRGFNFQFMGEIIGCIIGFACMAGRITWLAYLLGVLICLTSMVYCAVVMKEPAGMSFVDFRAVHTGVIWQRMRTIIGQAWRVCRYNAVIFPIVIAFSSLLFLNNVVDNLWPIAMETHFGAPQFSRRWFFMILAVTCASLTGSKLLTALNYFWLRQGKPTPTHVLSRCMIGTSLVVSMPLILLATVLRNAQGVFAVFAPVVLATELAYGVIHPCFESLVNRYIPDDHAAERATVLSTGSLLRSLLCVVLAIPSGGGDGPHTMNGWFWPAGLVVLTSIYMFYKLRIHVTK